MHFFHSRRLRYLCVSVFAVWLLFLSLRAVFYSGFSDARGADSSILLQALWIGARFDLRLAVLFNVPLFLLAYLPRWNLITSFLARKIAIVYVVLLMAVLLLIYIIDFGHYVYLGIRVDSTALRFFQDAGISAKMLWESYPVGWITLVWLLVVGLFLLAQKFLIREMLERPDPGLSRVQTSAGILLIIFLGIWGIIGRYSLVPLRWNHAFFSDSPQVAALGLNPVLYFIDTFEFREPLYEIDQVNKYYDDIAWYLGVPATHEGKVNPDDDSSGFEFARSISRADHAIVAKGQRPPNVIFIMLESLGASRLGIYGNPLKPSPVLDGIAEEGWLFKNFYVPVSGTARTVFASVTGLPDVTSVETATRNPFISEQHTIINAFSAHEKYYFIGGSAGWANMGALIRRSIKGVNLYQEGDYSEPVVDVWGISDLGLFREVDKRLKMIDPSQPFFAIIQTAGNHRPFTIPEDNEGFQRQEMDNESLGKWGFRSVEQFNAVRLLDYNIGLFLNMARESGYFDNTIFVFYGDHNNRITKTPHMAPFYEALDLDGLHVPHMIYAPMLLEPRVIDDAVSLVDVLPTVAGLLGVDYVNTSLGRDINSPWPEEERVVFTRTALKRYPVIGAVTRNLMLRMNYDETEARLHDLTSDNPDRDITSQYPLKAEKLKRLAKGIYETAKYMHHYNKPRLHNQEPASFSAEESKASAID
ncbi:MAG: sulfatase-like hydrolase/transferase [Gammaproteobacteria bacterium]|nr:sulfatase-like hydrolase/transferase [Gammaproteobacteria bacterium]